MRTYKVEYSSNNSGGSWWLKDEHWLALERAGWVVDWYRNRTDRWAPGERFLGALASSATKAVESDSADGALWSVLPEWERLTGQDPSDEGCGCCGCPHSFVVSPVDGTDRGYYTASDFYDKVRRRRF